MYWDYTSKIAIVRYSPSPRILDTADVYNMLLNQQLQQQYAVRLNFPITLELKNVTRFRQQTQN